jgi:hypothetical protein
MSINLIIIRPEPITQQEFEALVQNDPELDFSSLKDRIHGVYRAYQLSLNQGKIDIVSAAEFENLPVEKFIEIADRLNARLWEDFDGTFFCKDGENYQDDDYYKKCNVQTLLRAEDPRTQTSWIKLKYPLGCCVIFILLIVSLSASIYYYGVNGVYVILFWVFAFSLWLTHCVSKKERLYKKREKQSELMQTKIDHLLQTFSARLSEVAGTEKVLVITANGVRKHNSLELQAIDNALKGTSVIEKSFSGGESIVTQKSISGINAEIQKSRGCRTIVFYNAFSWENIVAELESLAVIQNSSADFPGIVVVQTVYGVGQAPIPVDLSKLVAKGQIALALCMFINRTDGKNGEWLIQDMKEYSVGISYQPPDGVTLVDADDLATFNREYTAHDFDEVIHWADAYSKGTGFKPFQVYIRIDFFEFWPERLNAAGIKTTVRIEDFYECCRRSIDAGGCFDGLNLTIEFYGYPVCLLCLIKVPFPNSGKIEAYFYCENEKLLETLKHAGLNEEK